MVNASTECCGDSRSGELISASERVGTRKPALGVVPPPQSGKGPSAVVLAGGITTTKSRGPLVALFGVRLVFPAEFVGLGDMSRGSILLKATRAGVELPYRRWA